MNEQQIDLHTAQGLTRRTIVRAAVWSAPVVAVAVAAPLAAASNPQPEPAPAGGLSEWQGSTSIGTWTLSQPNRVQINVAQSVGFNVLDPDTGDLAAPGKYTSGVVTVRIQWGTGSGVPTATSYSLEERTLNGWVRTGALPAAGESGSAEYTYVGIVNGAANVVTLPALWLLPVGGGSLTPSYVTTTLSSEFLSEKTSGARVP